MAPLSYPSISTLISAGTRVTRHTHRRSGSGPPPDVAHARLEIFSCISWQSLTQISPERQYHARSSTGFRLTNSSGQILEMQRSEEVARGPSCPSTSVGTSPSFRRRADHLILESPARYSCCFAETALASTRTRETDVSATLWSRKPVRPCQKHIMRSRSDIRWNNISDLRCQKVLIAFRHGEHSPFMDTSTVDRLI